MKLDGIHHITAMTADGPRNVDFYARVMGMRLSKKTVNQDNPTAYHLFYTDENASPGFDLTFFEYPGMQRGKAGAGMVHTVVHRVGSEQALDFWADRLASEGVEVQRRDGSLLFADPEGLGHELVVVERPDPPLIPHSTEVPDEFALQGFEAVRAYVSEPEPSERLLRETLNFSELAPHDWEARGEQRGGRIVLEQSSDTGVAGAGTVHHVAWAVHDDEQEEWRRRALEAGARATPVIDRFYFRSVYFREPGGVLFELATHEPGFTADEDFEHLGEKLSLPPDFEHLREKLEPILTPLPDASRWRRAPVAD